MPFLYHSHRQPPASPATREAVHQDLLFLNLLSQPLRWFSQCLLVFVILSNKSQLVVFHYNLHNSIITLSPFYCITLHYIDLMSLRGDRNPRIALRTSSTVCRKLVLTRVLRGSSKSGNPSGGSSTMF